MKRKIIKIDKELCSGCGACAEACHEGAIEMVDGKAELVREHFCDGLGDCLPACPTGAISFEEREAPEYDEIAVKIAKIKSGGSSCTCPGTASRRIVRHTEEENTPFSPISSKLAQWPCQIKLVPPRAPYLDGANLLIAADCTAYAYASFHNDFMRNHVTVIGCPKLDTVDYREKLTEILKYNDIKSLKIVRMEVPCCRGIEAAARDALLSSGKFIPWQVITITTDGKILQ